jgi:alpha-tubulin suppressor-like RCC1 family protein
VAVSGGLAFTSLGAGAIHSCGRTSVSTVYCWGGNAAAQLGTAGDSDPHYSPMLVTGLSAVAVAAGGSHSCALTAAGQAYCWGDNRYGQLGNTTNNNTG